MSPPSHGNKYLSPHARRVLLIVGFMLLSVIFFVAFGIIELLPRLHALSLQRTENILQEHFQSRVQFADYEVSLFPRVRLTISGLTLHFKGRMDLLPLFQVNKVFVYGSLTNLLRARPRISLVQL